MHARGGPRRRLGAGPPPSGCWHVRHDSARYIDRPERKRADARGFDSFLVPRAASAHVLRLSAEGQFTDKSSAGGGSDHAMLTWQFEDVAAVAAILNATQLVQAVDGAAGPPNCTSQLQCMLKRRFCMPDVPCEALARGTMPGIMHACHWHRALFAHLELGRTSSVQCLRPPWTCRSRRSARSHDDVIVDGRRANWMIVLGCPAWCNTFEPHRSPGSQVQVRPSWPARANWSRVV